MTDLVSRKEIHSSVGQNVPYLEIIQVDKVGPRSVMGYAVQFSKYGTIPVLAFDAKGGSVRGHIEMTEKDLDQIIAWATACKKYLEPVEDRWTTTEVEE